MHETGKARLTVSTGHAPLHHDDFLALPRVQNWHAGNRRVGLQGDRVYGVVGADDECDVRVAEVVVDFVHFQDDWRDRVSAC